MFPSYEGYFQIAVVPAVNQVGQSVQLLKSIRFDGMDVFTKEKIVDTASDINTGSVNDSKEGGSVQP